MPISITEWRWLNNTQQLLRKPNKTKICKAKDGGMGRCSWQLSNRKRVRYLEYQIQREKTGSKSTNFNEDYGTRTALERGLMVICGCGTGKENSGYDKLKERKEQNGQNLWWENEGNKNNEPEFMCIQGIEQKSKVSRCFYSSKYLKLASKKVCILYSSNDSFHAVWQVTLQFIY